MKYIRSITCLLILILFVNLPVDSHALASLTSSEKRQAILLNDVLLVTSDHSTGDWLMSTEKLMLHQVCQITYKFPGFSVNIIQCVITDLNRLFLWQIWQ